MKNTTNPLKEGSAKDVFINVGTETEEVGTFLHHLIEARVLLITYAAL